jgi:hypothetical protein
MGQDCATTDTVAVSAANALGLRVKDERIAKARSINNERCHHLKLSSGPQYHRSEPIVCFAHFCVAEWSEFNADGKRGIDQRRI